jgi:hypothetical protein
LAAMLSADKDCSITAQGVHQFYRRYVKRQARPRWESAPATPPAAPEPAPPSAQPTNPYKFNTDI